jgi:hypothetical protein
MPSDTLSIKVYGADKQLVDGEITMTFGLLNTLVRTVGDLNRVGAMDIDPDLADEVVDELMVPRTATGKRNPPAGYITPDLPVDQAHILFSWVKEHVLDFFLKRLTDTSSLMGRNQDQMKAIGSFLTTSKS